MKHGSLFSGIGGFDLASEWIGWENVFHCEWNEFGKKVLKHYWPDSESFNDITKTDFTKYENKIDILTGGFPCQPYSMAGKRLGKDDDRHLFPEMLRAIREIKPRWIVGENVLGIVNWNGGLVFEEVQADLESEGYEVQAFILPAVSVNAPHRRDRVWFVAHSNGTKQANNGRANDKEEREIRGNEKSDVLGKLFGNGHTSYSDVIKNSVCDGCVQRKDDKEGTVLRKFGNISSGSSNGIHLRKGHTSYSEGKSSERVRPQQRKFGKPQQGESRGSYSQGHSIDEGRAWDNFPTVSPVCSGNDGISKRLDGITFSKWRAESIKGYGNAVVPQVVYQIFKTIEAYENEFN